MSKGPSSQTVTQQSDPWGPQQPYLEQGMWGAYNDVLNGPSPYAPMDPAQQQSLEMQRQMALDPNSAMNQSAQYYTDMMNADPFTGPGAEAATDYVMSSVLPTVDSRFAMGNRSGSALHGEAIGRGVSLGLTPYMNDSMNRQMQAAAMAPGMEMMAPNTLYGVGGAYQADQQAQLDAEYNRLARYMGLVTGSYGGNSQTTSPMYGQSPGMGLMGGAMGGAGLGLMMGAPTLWPYMLGGAALGMF